MTCKHGFVSLSVACLDCFNENKQAKRAAEKMAEAVRQFLFACEDDERATKEVRLRVALKVWEDAQ